MRIAHRGSTPTTVRATLRAAGLRARHGLSQNFLADPDVLEAILAEADPRPGRRVLEIGPGPRPPDRRAARRPARRSRRSSSIAAWRRSCASGSTDESRRCRLIEGDALDQDLVRLVEPPYDVVANLPYHITSPILHALLGAPPRPERLVLMVQREVAERIAAPPGKMSYLSVFVQYHARVRIAVRVPRGGVRAGAGGRVGGHRRRAVRRRRPARPGDRGRAVAPRPGRLPRAAQDAPQRPRPASCRSSRRASTAALAAAGIDPDRRPQTLAVGEWLALREALGPIGPTGAAGGPHGRDRRPERRRRHGASTDAVTDPLAGSPRSSGSRRPSST